MNKDAHELHELTRIILIKSFWKSRNLFSKRGSATPTHSRSDRCRSFGASSQKFAEKTKFQKVLVKRFLAAGGKENE